jgi:hypothetical protein
MTFALRAYLASVVVALFAACDILGPGDCVSIGRYGLQVIAQDSTSGSPPPDSTRAIARDGGFADTVRFGVPGLYGSTYYLASERPGTYDVAVEAPGYRRWLRTDVRVARASRCDELQTVTLRALLQR